MKRLVSVLCLCIPLCLGIQVVNADESQPVKLNLIQMEQVNGGISLSLAGAAAGAAGSFVAISATSTITASTSVVVPGLNPSGAFSSSGSFSFAF